MKKKVVRLNEQDIENLVKKIINEAGGYDSPELGAAHSQDVMRLIYEMYKNISDDLMRLNNMRYDIVDDKLGRATMRFLKDINPVMDKFGKAWADAEKRRVQGGK